MNGMSQASLFPVNVIYTLPSSAAGLDGADLKWLARGDDGHDYAMKTMDDHPALPLTEWVCYQLWRACGLPVPDCAALYQADKLPAFGSRFELNSAQLTSTSPLTIASFFGPHLPAIAALYPLDAFITNNDRHGRNMLVRQGLVADALVSIDFSRAAMVAGKPFGKQALLKRPDCNTTQWWRYFRDRLKVQADMRALDAAGKLPGHWLADTINQAPEPWRQGIDLQAICSFWEKRRTARAKFARMWLCQP